MKEVLFIAGSTGLVGSALLRTLNKARYNVVTNTSKELDLTNQAQTNLFFKTVKPDVVIIAAGKVGGIMANSQYPADFIYKNMMIVSNCVEAAYNAGVKRLLYLGSSCIYPKSATIPITEDALLSGKLEPTNEPYAIAKIAGIKLCESYTRQYGVKYHSVMPCNLYGINDNYDLNGSHVIPALIRKIHGAKIEGVDTITLWGTGTPTREFLYSDDLAKACYVMLDQTNPPSLVNIGSGLEISIKDLAHTIKDVVGFKGEILFDSTKPDGTPRKTMFNSLIESYGWKPKVSMEDGLTIAYKDFIEKNAIYKTT